MIQKSNATVTVDLTKLKHNFDCLSSFLDAETRVMAVLKADAYGHGAVEVAKCLEPEVGAFAVNCIQEGIELREHDIIKPILVFEVPEQSTATKYRVHNLTATISSEEHFQWLPNGTSYHLNFDTGMGRLGFRPHELDKVAKLVENNRELFCTGLYTHFATADEPDSELVRRQHRKFREIQERFSSDLTCHIANTGGTAFYDSKQFNMARLGIGLYGYPPGKTAIEGLQPVLEWETRLVQLKSITAGESVSYGANWKAPEDGYLGIIPVGYEDGLRRNLTGVAKVKIGSECYDIVGRITMNYSMVYLREGTFELGTPVKLLYPENTATEWAGALGTIPYEILTSINPKIPRSYIS